MKIKVISVVPITVRDGQELEDVTKIVNETFEGKTLREIEDHYCERFMCHMVYLRWDVIEK